VNIIQTPIDGVSVIKSNNISDTRGSFSRLFCDRDLDSVLKKRKIVQINHSITNDIGSIRGMHFQYSPHAEMKLIRCLKGGVFDVVIDLRIKSSTFLNWYSQILTPENNIMFVIPEGCAHGFQTMEKESELLYLHTAHYNLKNEGGVRFDDPLINIKWPMPYTSISDKDKNHPLIEKTFLGINL